MKALVIQLPEAVEPYEQDLRRFFDAMIYKLALNAHKGRWSGYSVDDALRMLGDETAELKEAITGQNTIEIVLEAADCANVAMIAANISIERGDRKT